MIRKIKLLYQKLFWPYEKRARIAGVKIGSNNFIASAFWSSEPYLIRIGNNCGITSGVKIFTHGGSRVLRHKHPKFDAFGKVIIGDYVYIGSNSLIMPGVTIGNNVLIAAGSVVTKSIPDGCVVGGNPARYICSLDEFEQRNLRFDLQCKNLSQNDKKAFLLSLQDDKFIRKPTIEKA